MKCIDIENVTNESVTLNVDGEKLLNELYQDFKIELDDEGPIQTLKFQDAPFIEIYPNELYPEEKCRQLAIELMNRLNNEIKTKLNLK